MRIAAIVLVGERPANARRPAIISCSTQPDEKTSLGALVGSPRTCSGGMYTVRPHDGPRLGHNRLSGILLLLVGTSVLRQTEIEDLDATSVVRKTFSGSNIRWMTPWRVRQLSLLRFPLRSRRPSATEAGSR